MFLQTKVPSDKLAEMEKKFIENFTYWQNSVKIKFVGKSHIWKSYLQTLGKKFTNKNTNKF